MAKVMIVDDEIHIRKLLKYLIHWEALDLELAGEYDNAMEAIEQYQRSAADIVITDIIMPEMNGLDMIKKIREFNRECRIILISGYRDFEFAQKAVKLGVSDYIVKPINEEEINQVLYSIVNGIKNENPEDKRLSEKRKKFAEVINQGSRDMSVESIQKKYGLNFRENGVYRILHLGFCNCSEEDVIQDEADKIFKLLKQAIYVNCIEMELFPCTWIRYDIVIQYEKEKEKQILRCLDTVYRELVLKYKEIAHYRIYLSAGRATDNVNQISESASSAHFFLSGRLGYGDTRIYVADILPQAQRLMNEKNVISREDIREFERCIEVVNENGVSTIIHKLFRNLQERKEENYILYFYLIRELYIHMTVVFNRLGVHPWEIKKMEKSMENQMDNCDSVLMLMSTTERFCIDHMNRLLKGNQDHVLVYVNFAKEYIDKHYAENISLQTIAELAHVNPAYLSSLFKKSTGINYMTYVTTVRMEKAKELLCELDLNLSQIANKVGYTSTRYFSKIFESEVGMKPSEYRRVYLRGLR